MLRSKHSIMRKSAEFVKNALAFFWRFSGCVWHFFGTFLTSFGTFSDFQSGNPVVSTLAGHGNTQLLLYMVVQTTQE